MKDTEITLTERVVCFTDILGFKKLILGLESGEREIKNIFDILTTISEQQSKHTFIADKPLPNGGHSTKKLDLTYTHFSDSLFISMELPKNDLEMQILLKTFFWRIYLISKECFDKCVLLRGAITIGRIFHKDNMIFGQALVNSYNLSEKIAVYRRIIIDNLIAERFPNCSIYENMDFKMINKDSDGLWFIDFFAFLAASKNFAGAKKAEQLIKLKIKGSKEIGVYAKWVWLQNKFYEHFPLDLNSPLDFYQ